MTLPSASRPYPMHSNNKSRSLQYDSKTHISSTAWYTDTECCAAVACPGLFEFSL
jgi:hypothetical protein